MLYVILSCYVMSYPILSFTMARGSGSRDSEYSSLSEIAGVYQSCDQSTGSLELGSLDLHLLFDCLYQTGCPKTRSTPLCYCRETTMVSERKSVCRRLGGLSLQEEWPGSLGRPVTLDAACCFLVLAPVDFKMEAVVPFLVEPGCP